MNRFSFGTASIPALVLLGTLGATGTTPIQAGTDPAFQLLRLDGHHVKWGDAALGTAAVVSYAFIQAPRRFEATRNCSELRPIAELTHRQALSVEALEAETSAAFRVWEQAANISFVAVDDAEQADILIGAQGHPVGRAWANVDYRPEGSGGIRSIDQALICLNPAIPWKVGFDGDIDVYDIRYTLVHEIGHAIGLDHPGPVGQVMSFRYTEQFGELQPGDLRGVQLLYGARSPSAPKADAPGPDPVPKYGRQSQPTLSLQ